MKREYTVKVTTTHTVKVIADSSQEAKDESILIVGEKVTGEDEIQARCLGWVRVDGY